MCRAHKGAKIKLNAIARHSCERSVQQSDKRRLRKKFPAPFALRDCLGIEKVSVPRKKVVYFPFDTAQPPLSTFRGWSFSHTPKEKFPNYELLSLNHTRWYSREVNNKNLYEECHGIFGWFIWTKRLLWKCRRSLLKLCDRNWGEEKRAELRSFTIITSRADESLSRMTKLWRFSVESFLKRFNRHHSCKTPCSAQECLAQLFMLPSCFAILSTSRENISSMPLSSTPVVFFIFIIELFFSVTIWAWGWKLFAGLVSFIMMM